MKVLVVISAVLAVAAATGPGFAYSTAVPYGLGYNGIYPYSGLHYGGVNAYSSAVLPYSASIAAPLAAHVAAPLAAHVAAPLAAHVAAPYAIGALATKSQYHAQDEFGQASFGHATHDQTHAAFRDAAGGVTGHYSYVNPHGKIVSASYVADSLGYRVASNDLPIAPIAALEGPVPVQDTPEVIAARAEHFAAHAEVKSRQRRQALIAPLAYASHAYPYSAFPYAHPLSVAAHVRPATLTTIVNNPGHAISYRVD